MTDKFCYMCMKHRPAEGFVRAGRPGSKTEYRCAACNPSRIAVVFPSGNSFTWEQVRKSRTNAARRRGKASFEKYAKVVKP